MVLVNMVFSCLRYFVSHARHFICNILKISGSAGFAISDPAKFGPSWIEFKSAAALIFTSVLQMMLHRCKKKFISVLQMMFVPSVH